MANISMTCECNRNCYYCFAKPVFDVFTGDRSFSRTLFSNILNQLIDSNISVLHLLGGEPTLHADFEWAVQEGLRRDFKVIVFTNGLLRNKTIKFLDKLDEDKICLVFNLQNRNNYSHHENNLIDKSLSILNSKTMLGFNIYTRNPKLESLIKTINKYRLKRQVRLGLAHRGLSNSNSFLNPKHYRQIGKLINRFSEVAARINIEVTLDCGFVPCMFPQSFLDLPNVSCESIGKSCGPIPDILPDGSYIHCYPLATVSRLKKSIGISIDCIKKELVEKVSKYRSVGIFTECRNCPEQQSGNCLGGCLAMAMNRLRSAGEVLTISSDKNPILKTM